MRITSSVFMLAALCAVSALSCKDPPRATPAPAASEVTEADTAGAPAGSAVRAAAVTLEGKVVETIPVNNYTYINIDTGTGKAWAAVPKADVAVGAQVAVENAMKMSNFHSPSLNRSFEEIYFGVLRGGPAPAMSGAPVGSAAAPAAVPTDISVSKAVGANAFTVAEVVQQAEKLNGKAVTIQAMVVKVNTGILDKNWVHLRDGSGTDADKTNDILVTTTETPKVGDVVILKGKVATNKDFGSGYSYKVMVEEGAFTAAPAGHKK